MLKSVSLFSLLLLACTASYATSYTCYGVNETQGQTSFIIDGRSILLSGDWTWAYDEQQHSANCTGSYDRTQRSFKYYTANRSKNCPVDYVRVHPGFTKQNKGLISLVSKEDGDPHDYSGYAYAYFYCMQS